MVSFTMLNKRQQSNVDYLRLARQISSLLNQSLQHSEAAVASSNVHGCLSVLQSQISDSQGSELYHFT